MLVMGFNRKNVGNTSMHGDDCASLVELFELAVQEWSIQSVLTRLDPWVQLAVGGVSGSGGEASPSKPFIIPMSNIFPIEAHH